jgi:hypothetical protein
MDFFRFRAGEVVGERFIWVEGTWQWVLDWIKVIMPV